MIINEKNLGLSLNRKHSFIDCLLPFNDVPVAGIKFEKTANIRSFLPEKPNRPFVFLLRDLNCSFRRIPAKKSIS